MTDEQENVENKKDEKIPKLYYNMYKATGIMTFNDGTDIKDKFLWQMGCCREQRELNSE